MRSWAWSSEEVTIEQGGGGPGVIRRWLWSKEEMALV